MKIVDFLKFSAVAALAGCAAQVIEKGAAPPETLGDIDERADATSRGARIAGRIAFGGSVQGEFGAVNYGYLVTLRAGQRVVANLTGARDTDPTLSLYGPLTTTWGDARFVAFDDDGGPGLNSRISRSVSRNGTYMFVAKELFGDSGAFTLSLTCEGSSCAPTCADDAMCPTGSECELRVCVRAPCPSYCVPTLRCERVECGPMPLYTTRRCEDGTIVYGSGECRRTDEGVCRWHTVPAMCPPVTLCDPALCGSPNAVFEEDCGNGTVATPTQECVRQRGDGCRWVTRSTCPVDA